MKGVGSFAVLPLGNLIRNGSVEEGTTDPAHWFHTLYDTEWADMGHYGARSLRINTNGGTPDWRAEVYPVEANAGYRMSFWVKGQGSNRLIVAVRWFSDPEGLNWITEQWIPVDGNYADWTQIVQDVTAPANAQSGDIMFRVWEAGTIVDIYSDDFVLRRV